MSLAIFLIVLNLFKIIVIPYFPLIGDESFYWLWSHHLALSYDSHPPLIAYLNFSLTALFGPSELAIRLAAITIVLVISLFIYLAGKELFDKKSAAIATVVFNLLPTFWAGGLFLVPQTVFFLFWAIGFYLFVLIVKNRNNHLWFLLGLAAGLGLLSDHVMWLFVLGVFVYCLFMKEQRGWLLKKEPYLAFLLAMTVYSPVIIWNFRHNFMPFHFWGGSVAPMYADHLANFFGLQMVLYTPTIFCLTIWLIFILFRNLSARGGNVAAPILSIFSAVAFLPFLLISPLVNIGGHWTASAYFPAVLETGRAKKWFLWLTIGFALLVNVLGFTYYIFLYPVPPELKGKEFTINRQLPQFLKEAAPPTGRTFYFANNLGILGLVSFHGKTDAYMAKRRMWLVDQWPAADLKKGDNVIYFVLDEKDLVDKLKPLFRKVWLDPQPRLFAKDADIPTKTQVLHCERFKGGILP